MAGAILVGGRSRRMEGLDKTEMRRDGERVIRRNIDLLRNVCSPVLLICRDRDQERYFAELFPDTTVTNDRFASAGPLGSLAVALENSDTNVFLLACDMPFIEASLVKMLFSLFQKAPRNALLPRSPLVFDAAPNSADWQIEPLCSIWPHRCLQRAWDMCEGSEQSGHNDGGRKLSLTKFAQRVRARYVDLLPEEAMQMRNINTRVDLANAPGLEIQNTKLQQ